MNTASKVQAIALIKSAVTAGFKREVEVQKLCGRRLAVHVALSGRASVGLMNDYVIINISFRLGEYQSTAISTTVNYKKQAAHGLWSAGYAIRTLIETVAAHRAHGHQVNIVGF